MPDSDLKLKNLETELSKARQRIEELEKELNATERVALSCSSLQAVIFDGAPCGMGVVDQEGRILTCNDEAAELFGSTPDDIRNTSTENFYVDLEDRALLRSRLDNGEFIKGYELQLKRKDGSVFWCSMNLRPVMYHEQKAALITLTDINDQRIVLEALSLSQQRSQTLYRLSEMVDRSEPEILEFALEAAVSITGSEIGYIYFLSSDEDKLTLHAWSKNVMPQCSIKEYPEPYPVKNTGLWGEAIRRREPVITNDYENSPYKRGYPKGHVAIRNHLNVPMIDGDRIVLLVGVGNKEDDYVDEDVRQLQLLMAGIWRLIGRKRAEDALQVALDEMESKVKERTATLEKANEEQAILNMQLINENRERESTQRALEESENRFRSMFVNNHAVMLLVDSETGDVVDANPAAARFYGYSRSDLSAMNISDINILSKEELEVEMDMAREGERTHFFFRHRLEDGRIRDVEVFSGPVVSQGRELLHSIIHDITDRNLAEQELQRYARVISSSPDMISMIDSDYVYRMVNDAYLCGFKMERHEIIGKTVEDLIGTELFEKVSRPSLDKALSGETVNVSTWMELPVLGRRFLAVTYHPVEDPDGSIHYVSLAAKDMTDLKQSEVALQATTDRLTLASKAGGIGVWEWNLDTDEVIWDERMYAIYNVEDWEFPSAYEAWRHRVHPDDIAEAEAELDECVKESRDFNFEYRLIWPNREIRVIRAAAMLADAGSDSGRKMIGVNLDITEQRTMEENLLRLATTDSLTGAHNRRSFMERAEYEMERSKRYASPLTVLSLDIDHFKHINDRYGHHAGDEVLKALVILCKATLRNTDVFGRLGGEEFSALLTETDIYAGELSAERVRKAVEEMEVVVGDDVITLTVSIGLYEYDNCDDSLDEIMQRADAAMYRAKQSGRNRVEVEHDKQPPLALESGNKKP